MAVQLRKLLERTALYYPVLPDGTWASPGSSPWSPPWTQGHTWALTRRRWPPGCRRTTSTPAHHQHPAQRQVPLSGGAGGGQRLAVAGIAIEEGREPDAFEKNLMLAIVDECGLVLEKELLGQEKHRVEEQAQQEALRANLLRAISTICAPR